MRVCALALIGFAGPAAAFTPPVSGEAVVTRSADLALDSVVLPLGPWTPDAFPTETVEGRITRTAWRITPPDGFTTLSILAPVREALVADGWTLRLDCETDGCGGYDFRYSVEVFPEPQMHVDLGDFRYVSAAKGASRIGVMVSRTADLGFLEVVEAVPSGPAAPTRPAPEPEADVQVGTLQPYVLEGLTFASGTAALPPDQPVLETLLERLRADADLRIRLVGHSDASGDAGANLALSRDRAEAVRDWLTSRGIDSARLTAEGVGARDPRASDATEEGRARNRRVEVRPG